MAKRTLTVTIERTERGGVVCPYDDIHVDMHIRHAA
jgi:hypothetical protein